MRTSPTAQTIQKLNQLDIVTNLLSSFLSEDPQVTRAQKILVFGSDNCKLPIYLANLLPSCQIWVTDLTSNSIHHINQDAQKYDLYNIYTFPNLDNLNPDLLYSSVFNNFEVAIILLPKGRRVARRWLLKAYNSLITGGIVYLAGANNEGIKSVAKDASELFLKTNIIGYKHRTRLYRCVNQHASEVLPNWTREPGVAPGTWREFSVEIRGQLFTLHTLPGVFSWEHLDTGTQLLLDCVEIPSNSLLLDMGCGSGIIAMFASRLGASQVHAADNYLFSVLSTQENIKLNRITNVSVYASDLYSNLPDIYYDMIVSNPPFHAGKQVNYQVAHNLISQSYQRLQNGGLFTIVANRFIRYQKVMKQIFGNVRTLNEDPKFQVLSSKK